MRCGGPGLCSECTADASRARAALAQPSAALPPFAEKVLAKMRRFYDCASDFESGGVDIGRHWLDLLTQLGLLNRVQRSPALWEISQQGEDLLGMPQPSPAHELDPLGLAPHAEAFNEAPDEAIRPEQAEAERPEVVAYRTIGRHEKHQHPHYALNYYKQNAEDQAAHWRERGCEVSEDELMTVAQHERIVGALRAEITQLCQHKNDYMDAGQETYRALQNEIREREAEIARLDGLVSGHTAERNAAQHERIVGPLRYKAELYDEVWALVTGKGYMNVTTAISVLESERDAALARVAEMEGQEPVAYRIEARDERGIVRRDCLSRTPFNEGLPDARRWAGNFTVTSTPLYAAPVAQAQHSVPEEFSFEYRHPNGESHTVTVSRDQVINEMPDFLFEALCSKFCNCEPVGETNVVECCCDEYAEEFKLLAAAPGNSAQHSVPELLEWAVGRWHAEVSLRPLINVHRRALDDTWRQVIRRLGGDTGLLCGPSHDELLAAAPGNSVPQAWLDVQAERKRQVEVEGYHGFRDSHYISYELSKAARAYIEVSWHALSGGLPCKKPESWPWMAGFKWSDGRTMLVKAAALTLAEIERLDRAAPGKEGG